MSATRVLLADGSPVVLEAVTRMLEPEFEVIGTVRDGSSLIGEAEKLKPDVMIIDLLMPGLSGFEAIRRLKKRHVPAAVIFLTVHSDMALAEEARFIGAMGYVLNPSADRELLPAIRDAKQGCFFLSAGLRAG
jgi:DNA-binding NarL/FixJ family response regulator